MKSVKLYHILILAFCVIAVVISGLTIPKATGKYYHSVQGGTAFEINFDIQYVPGMDEDNKSANDRLLDILNSDDYEQLDNLIGSGPGSWWGGDYVGTMDYNDIDDQLIALFNKGQTKPIIGDNGQVSFMLKEQNVYGSRNTDEICLFSTESKNLKEKYMDDPIEPVYVTVFAQVTENGETKWEMIASFVGYALANPYTGGSSDGYVNSFDTDDWVTQAYIESTNENGELVYNRTNYENANADIYNVTANGTTRIINGRTLTQALTAYQNNRTQ